MKLKWDGPRRAVVFDKDGVLADSEAVNLHSAFEVFRRHGHALGEDDGSRIVGRHPRDYVPEFARRFELSEAQQQRIVEEQDVLYTEFWREHGALIDGTLDALSAVRSRGLACGLATSSGREEVDEFLERFGLADFFDVTLTLDDVSASKPDPEIYVSAARRLHLPASSMLVLEDSEHGVRAAKDAGAVCVSVRTRHVPAEKVAMADLRIESVAELPDLLDRTLKDS